MTVLLALLSALSAGTSDFLAGLASRRAPAPAVTTMAHLLGCGLALVMAAAIPADPVAADLGWRALAGLGGLGLLLVGLSRAERRVWFSRARRAGTGRSAGNRTRTPAGAAAGP